MSSHGAVNGTHGGAGGGGGGGGGHGIDPAIKAILSKVNTSYSKYCMIALGSLCMLVVIYRTVMLSYSRIRLWGSLDAGTGKQRYFALPENSYLPFIKKHILWAPLFRKRHNREIQLSSAVNVGTLPTRFQTIFLLGYLAANVLFCTLLIDWTAETAVMLTAIRNRTGVMAVVNMVPLFLIAGRNNPLIPLLGISFDTYNLMHRWFGRVVVLEALAHTGAYMANKIRTGGIASFGASISKPGKIQLGFIATVAFVFLLLHSPSMLRHAFYETFLTLHITVVLLAVITLRMHLKEYPTLQTFLDVAIILWAFDRVFRFMRIVYRNFSGKVTRATYEALPGDALRVTITMPRPWKFLPGQHAYLYIPRFGLWTSHPFSIAWSESQDEIDPTTEKLALYKQDLHGSQNATMCMIIRRRTGITDKLYTAAANHPDRVISTVTLVEGPYGGHHSFDSYGTSILIAGGVGITHQVPYVQHLLRGYAEGTVATRRIVLVWIIQSPEHLEWIRPWMTEILAMPKRREVLKIMLFVTRPRSSKEIISPSSTVQMFPGKPNIETLLDVEIEQRMGAMAVSVCGTGSLSDDVRKAVRGKTDVVSIDFIEESFTW